MSMPHLTRLGRSASELFVGQAIVTRVMALQGAFHADIDGALEAGQYGMAFLATQLALHNALFTHLAHRGNVGTLPADVRELGNQVFALLALHDPDGELTRQA